MPDMIEITLDGKKLLARPGSTILEVAESQGIEIPTLCHDPRLEPYASCWVCLVKVERAKGFVPSCGTRVMPGMAITTSSADVLAARRMALELLLSNHYGDCKAPCSLTCPSHIDIQGYLGLVANGRFAEAAELIRRDNPMPAVIGRVCPHPCEDACRRNLVDQPLAINNVKRFAADIERSIGGMPPRRRPVRTGKRVAVVGAGPAGLSAAWYLGEKGVDVTLFEASEAAGGMLRWGIPDYRLPPEALDASIRDMLAWGAELRCGVSLGRDFTLAELRKSYDAVVLAIGAWKCRALKIPGETHRAVLSGIDFLREVNAHHPPVVGERTAIIGGGNTALDAARCSLRCGAREVTIYYRRGREEMPASEAEIEEALEEGVRIEYLSAPVSIQAPPSSAPGVERDRLASLTLIRMELGEPDRSGRRRPVPVDGSEHEVPVDTVISAVGQYSDTDLLAELPQLLDEKGNLRVDVDTGATPVAGVFAAGDLATGTDIAIRAIAGGKHAARSVLRYFEGKAPERPKEFLSRKEELRKPSAEDYAHVAKASRAKAPRQSPEVRKGSFAEIESALPASEARGEAMRCLECGCLDVTECRLKEQAGDYGAIAERFLGEVQVHPIDDSHPFILRDPSKCILCGRCIRICLEVQGIGVLGYLYRGFASVVAPSFGVPFGEEKSCISCGQCVSACPVGALTEKIAARKNVPLEERVEEGVCSLCSVGCGLEYRWHGTLFTRVTERAGAPNFSKLCKKGKFGHDFLNSTAADGPRDENGKPISMELAGRKARELVGSSRHALMRISPRLCGEAIDAFLDLGARWGVAVEGVGLAGIDPRWARLAAGDGAGGGPDTDAGAPDAGLDARDGCAVPGAPRAVRILVGDIASSNNVAFTEALRAQREGREEFWIIGAPDGDLPAARAAARFEPTLGELPKLLEEAKAAGGVIRVVVNPQALLSQHGPEGQATALAGIGAFPSFANLRVILLWNDRNAGYLLQRLADRGPRAEAIPFKSLPDLMLAVGPSPNGCGGRVDGDGTPSPGDRTPDRAGGRSPRLIAWGHSVIEADLFIPIPIDLLIRGRSHLSGRMPLGIGKVNEEVLRRVCLQE